MIWGNHIDCVLLVAECGLLPKCQEKTLPFYGRACVDSRSLNPGAVLRNLSFDGSNACGEG